MKKQLIIGVMGGGEASPQDTEAAYKLGSLIAEERWILLNGGRDTGIMEASAKGAKDRGGLTIGILPDDNDSRSSEYIDVPILTGMGHARNSINVLSSHIIVACPGGAGTISEIALGLKNNKQVILLASDTGSVFNRFKKQGLLHEADTPEEVIQIIKRLM